MNDADRNCFLFSLDLKEKFVPQTDNKLIRRQSGYGPVFGSGYDVAIKDQCNNKNNSYANFPSTYNRAGGSKIEQGQASYEMFSGATDGN